MFARVARKSAAEDTWASGTRDFKARLDGIDCKFRWKLLLLVVTVGESRQVTGDSVVYALTAADEPCYVPPGWIHFTVREDALSNPEPMFDLALNDAKARLRKEPLFLAQAELGAFDACISPAPATRQSSRL